MSDVLINPLKNDQVNEPLYWMHEFEAVQMTNEMALVNWI